MKRRSMVYLLALAALLGSGMFAVPALGGPLFQINPTQQQQTVDAAIGQLFTQTAQAQSQGVITQTIEAGFQQAQTATAAFQVTVQAGFDLTTTALAPTPTAQVISTLPAQPSLRASRIFLQADLPADAYTTDDLRRAADVISLRLSDLGIGGATVEVQQDGTILVSLPPMSDTDTVIRAIQQRALLEFVDFSGLADQAQEMIGQRILTTEQVRIQEQRDLGTPAPDGDVLLNPTTDEPFETVLTGGALQRVEATFIDQTQAWAASFELTPEGAVTMGAFTEAHVGEPLAIVLDGVVLSAPTIQARLDEGGIISGGFTQDAVTRLVAQLRSGALPLPLRVEHIDTLEVTPDPNLPITPTFPAAQPTTAGLTPTIFPTTTAAQINVAEQIFEGGRMMWIQPTHQIWVLVVTETGRGTWMVYEDTFQDGQPEFDPNIVPPRGLYQPVRGFGKLWRENPAVREALGWGVTPEFGYISPYEYHPGGDIADGQYTPGPGYHVLYSLYGEQFRFNEVDGTWVLGANRQ